jgi:hypothetical protein
MSRPSPIAAARALVRGLWLQQWRSLCFLLGAATGIGFAYRLAASSSLARNCAWLGYLAMGLSICISFVLCSFTEADRRTRQVGFPIRLLTLPVSTLTLAGAPMAFGIATLWAVYTAWARFGLLDRQLPLTWPLLYLAAGVASFQAIVWALARHRILRIVVLGYVGSVLAMGWMAFREESDFAPELTLGLSESARIALCWALVGIGTIAFLMAWLAVEAQRSGTRMLGLVRWPALSSLKKTAVAKSLTTSSAAIPRGMNDDSVSRRQIPFKSAAAAQFWFEWRRHGRILPLATAGVLLFIMAPAPFVAPISSEMATLALMWIVATPLLIAFILGKAMGKADVWATHSGTPVFLATKPLARSEHIGAKLKAAAAAALSCWVLVAASTTVWRWCWCDCSDLKGAWMYFQLTRSSAWICGMAATLLLTLVAVTFRLLAGSLHIGLSGRHWMVNAAAGWVFVALFGGIGLALTWSSRPDFFAGIFPPPPWVALALVAVFIVRICLALLLAWTACRQRRVSLRAIRRYAVFWLVLTVLLVAPIYRLAPFENGGQFIAITGALFIVPMSRLALGAYFRSETA